MSKYIATVACTLACQNPAATAVIQVTGVNTYKASSGKNNVWAKQIDFIISAYTLPSGFVQSTPIQGSITATAVKTKASKNPVVLEGDKSLVLTIAGMVGDKSTTVTDTVYVKSAGQNVVKAT